MTAQEAIALRQAQMIAVLDEVHARWEAWADRALAFAVIPEPMFRIPDLWTMPHPEPPSLGIAGRITAAIAGLSIGVFLSVALALSLVHP